MAGVLSTVLFYNTEWVYIWRTSSVFLSNDEISDAIYDAQRQARYPEWAERTNELWWEKVDYNNKLYILNYLWDSAVLYQVKVTPVQVSKKVQKLMNNWKEYIISGWDLPSWGTTWQVLTKTATWAEWKDSKWWIQSDTVDWIWAGSESDYESEEKKVSNLYFVY